MAFGKKKKAYKKIEPEEDEDDDEELDDEELEAEEEEEDDDDDEEYKPTPKKKPKIPSLPSFNQRYVLRENPVQVEQIIHDTKTAKDYNAISILIHIANEIEELKNK